VAVAKTRAERPGLGVHEQRGAVVPLEGQRQRAADPAVRERVEHHPARHVDGVTNGNAPGRLHHGLPFSSGHGTRRGSFGSTVPSTATARSISALVVSNPRLQRVAETARHGSSGYAARTTGEPSGPTRTHALPRAMHTPSRSNAAARSAPWIFGNERFTIGPARSASAPFTTTSAPIRSSPRKRVRARSTARSSRAARSVRARAQASPKPTTERK